MSIGYRMEEGDDDDGESAMAVGDGCASLTPVKDFERELAASMAAVRELRAMGAVEVDVGDVCAKFPPLVERLDAGGLPVERPMRQVNRLRDPDELTDEEREYLPGA